MNLQADFEVLENHALAHDVLFGNTPEDMLDRATGSPLVRQIAARVAQQPVNLEFFISRLRVIVENEPANQFYAIGTYTLYLAFFSFFSSERARAFISSLNKGLSADSIIRKLNYLTLERMTKSNSLSRISDIVSQGTTRVHSINYGWSSSETTQVQPQVVKFITLDGTQEIKLNPN